MEWDKVAFDRWLTTEPEDTYDAYTDGYNNAMTDRVPVAVPDELDADDGALWIDGWCDAMAVRIAQTFGVTHDKLRQLPVTAD